MRFWRKAGKASPRLSITVIVYNMQREAPRTLRSLSVPYQQGVGEDDYEVIVVDNGSPHPIRPEAVAACGSNFRYVRIDNAHPSPARAVNYGVSLSRSRHVGVMIDGARMATPGIVRRALDILDAFESPVVTTIALHLGPDIQYRAMAHGYDAAEEDRLLATIEWPKAGYRLFEIGSLAGSSRGGWFAPLAESNCMFMRRSAYDRLGGMDEKFVIAGGGLVNLDFYNRACDLPETALVCLFGEATFHQVHGGTMTNRAESDIPAELRTYQEEYEGIRGHRFAPRVRMHAVYGYPNGASTKLIMSTLERMIEGK